MDDDKTREEFEANESLGTNSHLRSQVYQMIEELDGQPIDTDKYLVDNNQTTDANDNIIKEKKVNVNN